MNTWISRKASVYKLLYISPNTLEYFLAPFQYIGSMFDWWVVSNINPYATTLPSCIMNMPIFLSLTHALPVAASSWKRRNIGKTSCKTFVAWVWDVVFWAVTARIGFPLAARCFAYFIDKGFHWHLLKGNNTLHRSHACYNLYHHVIRRRNLLSSSAYI